MPRAVVLNSAGKNNCTGGTFADTLTAFSLDSLTIPVLQTGKGKIVRMWGIDSDNLMELALTDGRVDSIHDPTFGIRFNNPALSLGGAAAAAAFPMLEPPNYIDVYTGDALIFTVTTTAADDVVISWLSEYQDLPGVQAKFANWQTVINARFTEIGVRVAAVANGTAGSGYGTARALNADETRWTGGRFYAIVGYTLQTPVTTVSFKGAYWGNLRFGGPGGAAFLYSPNYFLDLNAKYPGENLIPVFNGYDAGNVFCEVADGENSTSPKVDVIAVECLTDPSS